MRDEGAALFSLMRNLGSSIGISITLFMLVRNTQTMHESLAAIFGAPAADPGTLEIARRVHPGALSGLPAVDDYVTHQAAFVAHLNDYQFLMSASLVVLPLLLLVRKGRSAMGGHTAAME